MRRRDCILLICGVAATWPLTVRAQQPDRVRRIGVLMGYAESDPEVQSSVAAFREELRKLGWTEGRNIEIDTRWAPADVELMKRFAKELVALQPDFIITAPHPLPRRCCNRHVPFRSFSCWLPILSVAASSRACRGQAATRLVSPPSWGRWVASGWNSSRRLHRASPGSPYCSTRQRRHLSKVI